MTRFCPSFFSRMLRRRVPVLRLGSRGPGGDARSLRLCPQAPAIIRNRSRRVGGTKIVAKRRTVVTCYVSYYKSVNSHRDRGGPGRETQNCRHFWTRLASSRLKGVNSYRDRGGPGRETQNCRHFWTCFASSRLNSVNSHRDRGGPGSQKCHRDRGGSWSRSPELSSLLDSSRVFVSQ